MIRLAVLIMPLMADMAEVTSRPRVMVPSSSTMDSLICRAMFTCSLSSASKLISVSCALGARELAEKDFCNLRFNSLGINALCSNR